LLANWKPDHASQEVVAGKLKGTRFLSSSIKEYWVLEAMRPIERFCANTSLTPNAISLIGFGLTVVAAICLATDHLVWGGWFVIWSGCCDFLDGRIARIKGMQSQSGAFLDSVLDRYMDFAALIGLAIYFSDTVWVYFVYLALLGTSTTPYIKAKSESLGIESSGGEMQRPERIVILGVGALLSGYMMCLTYPFLNKGSELPPYLLILGVIVVAYASNKVALERFLQTFRLLQANDSKSK